MNIEKYESKHATGLIKIIRNTWKLDDFIDKKTGLAFAKIFLYACLSQGTAAYVATTDNNPVGLIICHDKKKKLLNFKHSFSLFITAFPLLFSRHNKKIMRIAKKMGEINSYLLEGREKLYRGEILLFAVDENYRGKGIGKALYNSALSFFAERNIEKYYLFTDTMCNYGFYDHLKMQRVREKKARLWPQFQEDMTFFLYDNKISINNNS